MTTTTEQGTAVAEAALIVHGDTLAGLSLTEFARLIEAFELGFLALLPTPPASQPGSVPEALPELNLLRLRYRNPLDAVIVVNTSSAVVAATAAVISLIRDFRIHRRVVEGEARLRRASAPGAEQRLASDLQDAVFEAGLVPWSEQVAATGMPWHDLLARLIGDVLEGADQRRKERLRELLADPIPRHEARPATVAERQRASELDGVVERFHLQPDMLDRPDVVYALTVLAEASLTIEVVSVDEAERWTPPD